MQHSTFKTLWSWLARTTVLGFLLVLAIGPYACFATSTDDIHRTAIISAYEPEWLALQNSLEGREEYLINGTVFVTGAIEHKPVVMFLSGISMVNAAMTTQLALDHFQVDRLVFSA
jgi:adenosylhomocysteine nucleosidase